MSSHRDTWRSGGTGIGQYTLTPQSTSGVPLTIDMLASQTAVPLRVRDSAGTTIFSVTAAGNVTLTGSITAVINETLTGNVEIDGTLTVDTTSTLTGAVSLGSTLSVTGASTLTGAVSMVNNATVGGTLIVTGNVTHSSNSYTGPIYSRIQGGPPNTDADHGILYTALNGGRVELYYKDNVGGVSQLTTAGGISSSTTVRLSNGTAAIPSLSFVADSDTGLYRVAADQLGFTVAGAVELTLNATNLSPGANDGLALGVSGTAFADLFLASGAVINIGAGEITITATDANTLTIAGTATLIDIAAGILELNNAVRFDTGIAIVAASYSVGRDADGTNQLHFNVPTGATFEWSVNDAAEMTLSATAVNFQNNSITTTGGGSLTGTWTDLGAVTTVDINGGTLDGAIIGGAVAAAITGTTITANTSLVIAGGSALTTSTQTGTGNLVLATSPTLVTPTLGVASATSINFGGTALSSYVEGTFTPTVTLVGGAGNTTPVYTTNTGRHTRIGNRAYVDVYLTGDGGDEGAGTGTINIALPLTAGASNPTGPFIVGRAINNVTEYIILGQIAGSATTISLSYFNLISTTAAFTGADQNNATRTIRLQFFYEI